MSVTFRFVKCDILKYCKWFLTSFIVKFVKVLQQTYLTDVLILIGGNVYTHRTLRNTEEKNLMRN